MKKLDYRRAIESCIEQLVKDFQSSHGHRAFNFLTEEDLRCQLFAYLRGHRLFTLTPAKARSWEISLVRAQAYGRYRPRSEKVAKSRIPLKGYFQDIVVWDPWTVHAWDEDDIVRLWKNKRERSRIPRFSAIEIELFGGTTPKKLSDFGNSNEFRNLKRKPGLQPIPYTYYLGFVNHDMEKDTKSRVSFKREDSPEIKKMFKKLRKKFKETGRELGFLVVSRDGWEIRVPRTLGERGVQS